MLFMECGGIFKMTSPLTIQERAKIAARYEERNFIVLVQRGSGAATHWILWINPGAASCWGRQNVIIFKGTKTVTLIYSQRDSYLNEFS